LAQIARLLEMPGNIGPSCPSPPTVNLHMLRKEAAAQREFIFKHLRFLNILFFSFVHFCVGVANEILRIRIDFSKSLNAVLSNMVKFGWF
jgi:hypothetical protein